MDQKLREDIPGATLPALPIDASTLPALPPKRKSTFLNTLSRLASPSSSKAARNNSSNRRATNASVVIPSTDPTPITSPSSEIIDPFTSLDSGNDDGAPVITSTSAISTGVAAYLTTVSNTPALRQARVWKRFVRVRTDDLESVRVERAIKRVRSDLAAHVGSAKPKEKPGRTSNATSAAQSDQGSIISEKINGHTEDQIEADVASLNGTYREAGIREEEEYPATTSEVDRATDGSVGGAPEGKPDAKEPIDLTEPTARKDDEAPATPVASEAPASRIHRSQSADPDKSSRLSRAFVNSAPTQDGASSQASQTGDESSISTKGDSRRRKARKKRSMSMDPNRELQKKKSQRKVVIDDFEMMRVLGKGCAGKVLLVKHKTSTDLYALKAITKRHVLAHQELQHTLTEQAVLKRMAAESKDPFVVKLWWSFHDKENLFLVMVSTRNLHSGHGKLT